MDEHKIHPVGRPFQELGQMAQMGLIIALSIFILFMIVGAIVAIVLINKSGKKKPERGPIDPHDDEGPLR